MFLFQVVVFIFNLFQFILKLLDLFLLLFIDIFQSVDFFIIFSVLLSSNFNIHHAPEKTTIGNILLSSVILQELKVFQISGTHIISYHTTCLLEVHSIDLLFVC